MVLVATYNVANKLTVCMCMLAFSKPYTLEARQLAADLAL